MIDFSILIYIIPDLLLSPARKPLHLPVWIETCLPTSILIYSWPLHLSRYFSLNLWHQQSWWSFRANHFYFRLKWICILKKHTHGDKFVKKSRSIVPWPENQRVIIENVVSEWLIYHTVGIIPESNIKIIETEAKAA